MAHSKSVNADRIKSTGKLLITFKAWHELSGQNITRKNVVFDEIPDSSLTDSVMLNLKYKGNKTNAKFSFAPISDFIQFTFLFLWIPYLLYIKLCHHNCGHN